MKLRQEVSLSVIDAVIRHGKEQPDAPALIGNPHALTYSELATAIEQTSAQLHAIPARVIALALDNSPLWAILDLATLNIGKPVINPVMPRAWAVRFSPVFDRMNLAILRVPPVLSREIPIIAPRMIRNPIEAIVLPKPCCIVATIVFGGRTAKARKTDTIKSAMKASSLSFDVRTIIAIILIPTRSEDDSILITEV